MSDLTKDSLNRLFIKYYYFNNYFLIKREIRDDKTDAETPSLHGKDKAQHYYPRQRRVFRSLYNYCRQNNSPIPTVSAAQLRI